MFGEFNSSIVDNLTKDDILKVLECCSKDVCPAKECPLYYSEGSSCIQTISKLALKLINDKETAHA